MKKIICIHAIIEGKVQGVFYRENTRQQADKLNITGWVKNNIDGTVELQACGENSKIEALITWLNQGPPKAQVTKVDWEKCPHEQYQEFIILR